MSLEVWGANNRDNLKGKGKFGSVPFHYIKMVLLRLTSVCILIY